MTASDEPKRIPRDLAEELSKEVQGTAKHSPDTEASQHYCPVHGWYPATSTAHEGH